MENNNYFQVIPPDFNLHVGVYINGDIVTCNRGELIDYKGLTDNVEIIKQTIEYLEKAVKQLQTDNLTVKEELDKISIKPYSHALLGSRNEDEYIKRSNVESLIAKLLDSNKGNGK